MSLINFLTGRHRRPSTPKSSSPITTFRPQLESLEARDCPSVTAPTGLQIMALSSTQVKLTWNDVPSASGFRVYEWDGVQQSEVNSSLAHTTTLTINQLAPYHEFYFSVQAYDQSSTATSAWVSVVTLQDPITAPTNVHVVAATLTQLTLTWSPASGASSYNVDEWNGSQWVQAGSTGANTTTFEFGNLTQGTYYYFEVEAVNATNSAMSAVATGLTQSVPLTTPGNLQLQVVNNHSITLKWNSSTGQTGYNIYRWDGLVPFGTRIATVQANVTSYQDSNLQAGKSYWYYVQAVNAVTVANSAWESAETTGGHKLLAPTGAHATAAGTNAALLTWNPSAGAVGYRVYVWTGTVWDLVATTQQGSQKVKVGGLAAVMTHWFYIEAITANNQQLADTAPFFVNL